MKFIACTTFPDFAWDLYAKDMVTSFVKHWDVPLMINLDTPTIQQDVAAVLRDTDRVVAGYEEAVGKWLEFRHESDKGIMDYRQQCARFAHKIFTIQRVLEAAYQTKGLADYLIWIDADIVTNRKIDDIAQWVPKDALISYIGRKDWNHSECGFKVIKICQETVDFYNAFAQAYLTNAVDTLPEKHDSFVFDVLMKQLGIEGYNLTEGVSGRDVFEQSSMGKYMTHHKGPAKLEEGIPQRAPLKLETKNCVPDDDIQENVKTNRWLIKDWIKKGKTKRKKVIMCAAGPSLELYIDEIREWQRKGNVVVAVKHAIGMLEKHGVEPDYIVLLDPRAHVERFVQTPSVKPTYIVASMVKPEVPISLYKAGCKVIGYHAAVNAGEHTVLEPNDLLVSGGTAASTRAISIFQFFGYSEFELYGYDLSCWDKPDMEAKDSLGGPKYIYAVQQVCSKETQEVLFARGFYAEPQWLVQAQELREIAAQGKITLNAHGFGLAPWMLRAGKAADRLIKEQKWTKNCQCKMCQLLSKLSSWLRLNNSK